MPKTVKGDPLRFFNTQFVAKYQKIEREPFGDNKNFSKKSRKAGSHSAEKSGNLLLRNACKKN